MRILIVEDDKKIGSFISKGLKEASYAVDLTETGEDGYEMAMLNPYDAAIVDIMLPGIDGLTLIERLRIKGKLVPVLILSARHTVDDRIEGLQKGGDDYLTKPFSFSELLVRIQALIRRSTMTGGSLKLTVNDLSMDLTTREVIRDGTQIELQPKEYALLEYFMRNPGRVLSKTLIMEHIWDYSFDPQTNVVDVLVHRLRNRIDKDFPEKIVHTIRGVGYVLKKT